MRHRMVVMRLTAAAVLSVSLVLTVAGMTGCSYFAESEPETLVLASTTSTQDSGLFDVLIPAFEEAYPEYKVEVVAVGTGEALALGRSGDADVLLVHAKTDEENFVTRGFGTERRDVMYNDFIIVGPKEDPAGIGGMKDAPKALADIATTESLFVSRGDDSGTHKKELALWKAADLSVENAGPWYMSVGQGMGDSLRIASEQGAYILTDRATYLANKDSLALVVMVEGDEALYNQYGVIPVTNAANPEGARAFADWVTGPEAGKIIEEFGVEEYGQPLFTPNPEE